MRTETQPATTSRYRDAAIEIGNHLVAGATAETFGVTWTGDDLIGTDENSTSVVHGPVGPDLYGGAAGIAWFLGHLARATASQVYADVARDALVFSLSAARRELCPTNLSLYSGATGIALAAAEVANALDDVDLRCEAFALARDIADAIIAGAIIEMDDLLGGLAGVGIGLLALHRMSGDSRHLDATRLACEQLVARRSRSWWGDSWPDHEGQPGLCGLGHGASGIGLVLAEAAWLTGDASLLDAAHAAFTYERGHFARERSAWPDLRKPESPGWTTAWCHGALGIGAVRLRLHEATGEDWALAEASAALLAGRALAVNAGRDAAQGIAHDATLCHGLGGVTELILLASEILNLPEHQQAARRLADLCLKIRALNGGKWTTGLAGCTDVPGLFIGIAGIGVTMLRVDNPAAIGSPMLPGRPAITAKL
ncbi:lanthionine synthetase LanC family protein [Mesorhizobium sp. IMUNJ 23232]|uniref:lanthionine synthetase LanC family protein n=1 Tax=Mesorhizobium sp. IMUNJ 23232 TaxID=3376064 RepID=UPI0037B34761